MRNFEKDLDRVIDTLKEINEILKECNIEMAKALHVDKETADKYVIIDNESGAYVMSIYTLTFGRLEDAKVFDNRTEALNWREQLSNECEDVNLVVKKVKIKAVE